MKRTFFVALAALLSVAIVATPVTTDALTVKNLKLKKSGSFIRAAGKRAVVIKDKVRINQRLNVRKAIFSSRGDVKIKDTLRPTRDGEYNLGSPAKAWGTLFVDSITVGGTVDGVDVSDLSDDVDVLEAQPALPTDCSSDQIPSFNGTAWVCSDDSDTTYTAGSGLALSGTELSMKGTSYDNVVIVASSGGDYTTIQAAIDSITDASNNNEYLIWVAPGIYAEEITLDGYITLQGAGQELVLLGSTTTTDTTGIINIEGYGNEVRDLSISAYGPSYSTGIYSDTQVDIDNVTITATDPPGTAYGVYLDGAFATIKNSTFSIGDAVTAGYGVYADESSVTIKNTDISVRNALLATAVYGAFTTGGQYTITDSTLRGYGQGYGENCRGLHLDGATLTAQVRNSKVLADGCGTTDKGLWLVNGTAEVLHSVVQGDDDALDVDNSSTLNVGASQVDGTVSGTATCGQSYDGSYADLNASCS
jgi:hypothetical protein